MVLLFKEVLQKEGFYENRNVLKALMGAASFCSVLTGQKIQRTAGVPFF